jgi:aminoglycoside N3'-acetyltransferase
MCSTAQYLAELMCLRRAERNNEGNLAFKFWNKSQKKSYQAQIVSVNRLIKQFGEDCVIEYLMKENTRVFSTGFYHPHKWLADEIKSFKVKFDKRPKPKKVEEDFDKIDTEAKPRKQYKKKNLFNTLRNIDNGKSKED